MCYERQMVKDGRHKKRISVGLVARRADAELTVFLTDTQRLPDPAPAISMLPKRSLIIVRDYDHPDRVEIAYKIAAFAKQHGHQLSVAADIGLARAVGASAIHLPEYKISDRRLIHRARACGLMVSAACHNRRALWFACDAGVDFALVSPVFQTQSHVGARSLGPHRFARLTDGVQVPVVALGGINANNARRLMALELAGVAGISGIA